MNILFAIILLFQQNLAAQAYHTVLHDTTTQETANKDWGKKMGYTARQKKKKATNFLCSVQHRSNLGRQWIKQEQQQQQPSNSKLELKRPTMFRYNFCCSVSISVSAVVFVAPRCLAQYPKTLESISIFLAVAVYHRTDGNGHRIAHSVRFV